MDFDLNAILAEMLAVIKNEVSENWKRVKGTAMGYIKNKKDRLDLLVSLRLHNEIEEEFFLKRLEDEKKIFESELMSLQIMSAAIAQRAANAAFDVLNKAVETALKLN